MASCVATPQSGGRGWRTHTENVNSVAKAIEKLVVQACSQDRAVFEPALDRLVDMRDPRATDSLHEMLLSEDGHIRNRAACSLRRIGEPRSRDHIAEAIKRPANACNRGTLVWALQVFDCGDLFELLFDCCLSRNFEVECMALSILEEQDFRLHQTALAVSRNRLKSYSETMDASRPELRELVDRLGCVLDRSHDGQ